MLGDFLPGELVIARGEPRDYESLARFHYVAGRPGTWAGVWVAKYRDEGQGTWDKGNAKMQEELAALPLQRRDSSPCPLPPCPLSLSSFRIVAIAVLSWCPLGCTARDSVLNLRRFEMKKRAQWLNKNMRTISRVVVHPQFRGVGLGSELVRRILRECPTRYVETIAAMGKVHPFFEKAGMTRIQHDGDKAYFIFDRKGE